MTTFEIAESFNWLSPEFKLVDSGKNTIRIKGVALKGNVVSRNKRKYVDEELQKAARTWIGKPVTINHDGTKKVGHVVWMEYEDGALEYLADVNKQPYVGLLRDKSTDIRGVSIEADYLHNRCPKCGEKFYSEEDFAEHMWTKHFVRADATKEPHGIVGQALSLVLAPEEPGYPDSTIELAETVGKPGLQLLETVIKVKIEEENYMAKLKEKAVVTPEKRIPWDQTLKEQQPRTDAERAQAHFNITDEEWDKLSDEKKQEYIGKLPERGSAKEQEEACPEGEHRNEEGKCVPDESAKEQEESCPEGQHKDPDTGECVPDKVEEQEEHKCPEGEHWSEEEDKCVADKVAEQEDSTQECPVGFHRDSETGECVPDEAALPEPLPNVVVGEIKLQKPMLKPKLLETLTPKQLRLGEPFADYADFADCVAKNQDKDDPEAYCGQIKHQVEGETIKLPNEPMTEIVKPIATIISKEIMRSERGNTLRREKALLTKLNETIQVYNVLCKSIVEMLKPLLENDALTVKRLDEVVASLNKTDTELAKQITESVKCMNRGDKAVINYTLKNAKLSETKLATLMKARNVEVKKLFETLPKPDVSWKQEITELKATIEKLTSQLTEAKANYDKILNTMDVKFVEVNDATTQLTESNKQKDAIITGLQEKLAKYEEKQTKTVKETESLAVRMDNVEEKRKGKFQGHNKTGEETPQEYAEDPRKGD